MRKPNHPRQEAPSWVAGVRNLMRALREIESIMALQATLDAMKAAVAANTTAVQAVSAAVQQLKSEVAANAAAEADVQAAIDAINANNTTLTSATA